MINGCTIIFAVSVLLGTAGVAGAETLYQWKEPDGSLTFSPTPPPQGSGIEYRLMNTGGEPAADISLPETTLSASDVARSQPATLTMLPRANSLANQQVIPRQPEQVMKQVEAPSRQPVKTSVEYAPVTKLAMRNALPEGISRAKSAENNRALPAKKQVAQASQEKSAHPEVLASKQKSAHCADLGKRIMALENRVGQSQDAEQMDSAILQISKYQQSYNRHCD